MSVADLTFTVTGSPVTDPLTVGGTTVSVVVTNNGDDTVSGAGIYIAPATFTGPFDAQPSSSPETDYVDLLTWGTASHASGGGIVGGLKLVSYVDDSAVTQNNVYITNTTGYDVGTKLLVEDLAPAATTTIEVVVETPPSVTARNLYFDFRVA